MKIKQSKKSLVRPVRKPKHTLSAKQLAIGLQNNDRHSLARLITLVESTRSTDQQKAWSAIQSCTKRASKSIRIGITGPPGVGKSTFIESFGLHILNQGHKVAVLAIDPSSTLSGGSILGDKTRMPNLSAHSSAFIRPSPSGGSLGGVAGQTPQVIQLCELAGYDVILVETVGVGQSETAVHAMTDFFLLLALAGSGDELQGMKRGIMEMADAVLVTKADGDNIKRANLAKAQINSALHLFPVSKSGWIPKAECVSAYESKGISQAWQMIEAYRAQTSKSGFFSQKRERQVQWFFDQVLHFEIVRNTEKKRGFQSAYDKILRRVQSGKLSVKAGVSKLLHKG